MDRESWWSKEHLPQYETLIGCHHVNTCLWLVDKWQMAPSGLLGHEYFNKMILLPRLLEPTTNYFERWEIVLYLYTKHINHCTNLHGSITKIMNNSNVQSMTHLPIMLLFGVSYDLCFNSWDLWQMFSRELLQWRHRMKQMTPGTRWWRLTRDMVISCQMVFR